MENKSGLSYINGIDKYMNMKEYSEGIVYDSIEVKSNIIVYDMTMPFYAREQAKDLFT